MKRRKWVKEQLQESLSKSRSLGQLLVHLGLKPVGGNYAQIKKYLHEASLDYSHLKGRSWEKGLKRGPRPVLQLADILVQESHYQSFKLKRRLFDAGLKQEHCEICGWAERTPDGYLPLELDHINGAHTDNRIENLRILCPNCHSLQPTHRGRKVRE
ncbi:MAG: HNH endonuclease [Patescibacteria group bacterium]|mgnify:CR=1 FL=1